MPNFAHFLKGRNRTVESFWAERTPAFAIGNPRGTLATIALCMGRILVDCHSAPGKGGRSGGGAGALVVVGIGGRSRRAAQFPS